MRHIGVDIGAHSIKCVVLKKVKGSYIIHSKKAYFYPEKESFAFPKWLKSSLQDFTKIHKIKRPLFSFSYPCGIPSPAARVISLPKVNKKELTQSIHYEVEEKNMLQGTTNFTYKSAIVQADEDALSVLVAVAEKNLVKTINGLKSPLWNVLVAEPQVLSLGRLIADDCVVIDFGHLSTRVLAYKSGKPFFIQAIPIGGKFITQKISDGRIFLKEFFELSDLSDEEIKHEYGAVLHGYREIENNPITLKVADLISETTSLLSREIKQLLRTIEINNDFKATNFYFTGEGSKLRYLVDYVGKELSEELVPLDFTSSEEEAEDLFVIASGAGLYKDYPYFREINFMIADSIHIDFQKVFFTALGLSLILHVGMFDLNRRLGNFEETVNTQLAAKKQTEATLRNKINTEEAKVVQHLQLGDKLMQLQKQKKWLSDILFELPPRTPKGVVIRSILIHEGDIRLSGTSENYSDIAFLATALEEIGKTTISSITSTEHHSFVINLVPHSE